MLQSTWIALVLGFWSSLYLLDVFLKTKKSTSRSYIQILENSGLVLSICQVRWYTNSLNRTFLRVGQWQPHFLRLWFTAGVCFGLVAMLVSLFVLTLLVVNTFRSQPVEHQVLRPVMPGVNLPTSQISYYLLTLLVCAILHEVGHAVAAVREQVRVNGFGIFMFLMYPGAFVDISTEHIQVVSPIRQLRIFCAGVWHNFVIVVIAVMVLLSMPYLLVPFYSQGQGVCVQHVVEKSAVSGPRGLIAGETITYLSDCPVTNVASWYSCIIASSKEQSLGHCMPVSLIKDLDTKPKNFSDTVDYVDCCNVTSNTHLCFMYHSKKIGNTQYACLPARTTTDRPVCKLQSDCYMPNMDVACVYPAIDNETKLLRIIHGRRPPLLFLGHPADLFYSVSVLNYVPKSAIIPINLPYVMETFCKYLISLSGALIILNVVPCYALDGQWICHAFIELSLRSTITDGKIRGLIYYSFLLYGTLLLLLNVTIAMWTLFL